MTRLDEIKKYLAENGDVDGQDATWLINQYEDFNNEITEFKRARDYAMSVIKKLELEVLERDTFIKKLRISLDESSAMLIKVMDKL